MDRYELSTDRHRVLTDRNEFKAYSLQSTMSIQIALFPTKIERFLPKSGNLFGNPSIALQK